MYAPRSLELIRQLVRGAGARIVVVDVVEGPRENHAALDNPMWHALQGPHRRFARIKGRAARYDPAVSPFAALPDQADAATWAELASLLDHGEAVVLARPDLDLPASWETAAQGSGVQMIGPAVPTTHRSHPDAVALGPDDVAEMLDLVARTEPGPFLPRTVELGGYVGIRREGRLVAMAGHRLRVDGFVEISAVCTDAEARGQGLASALVNQLLEGIASHGERAFLHAATENVDAIRLYESLGFTARRTFEIVAARPAGA